MYFMALALDFDGTIAHEGKVSEKTLEALKTLKSSGRKLLMVTGRQLTELKETFDRLDLFDCIVAENGALLYIPQTEIQKLLSEPPPEQFFERLKNLKIDSLSCGKVIVATFVPHEQQVLETIKDMGLGLDIIFNKGAVMVLPSGVNKATGLKEALKELKLSPLNVIGVGDAENDHVFLRAVGLGVAVANASDSLKVNADLVTKGSCGEGVEELIGQLVQDESIFIPKMPHKIAVGVDRQEQVVELNPTDRVLIAGNSGIGKSTLATALTEKMVENEFQFCIFDPEGDYEKLENALSVGEMKTAPSQEQVMELLEDPSHNVVVNTLGVELKERPAFFINLAPQFVSLKASLGRPHWLIIDEAHHLLPAAQNHNSIDLPKEGTLLITVHPKEVAAEALKSLNVIITLGPRAQEVLKEVSQIIEAPLPENPLEVPNEKEVLIWQREPVNVVKTIIPYKPKQQHKRHTRKYAQGDLSEEYCFYFRGPKNNLNLKAQNLMIFLQMAEGVDEETWMHHLRNHDYSGWFKEHIKDDGLAEAALQVENDPSQTAKHSRKAIAQLIKERYTAPASAKD